MESVHLKALRDFSRFLHGSWESEIMLIELLDIFKEIVGCGRASAYLLHKSEFKLMAKIGDDFIGPSENLHKFIEMICPEGWENFFEPVGLGTDDMFLVPLMCAEQTYGLILFTMVKPTQGQTDMISIFTNLAAMSFKNSYKSREREVLEEVINTFASGLDIQIYYPQFAHKLEKIVAFDNLTIIISDPFHRDKMSLYVLESSNQISIQQLVSQGSATALIISTGEAISDDDLSQGCVFPEDALLIKKGIRCSLRVPLVSKGRIIGTLSIGSKMPFQYGRKEINLLTEIANRIGPSVENSLIYEAVNDKLSQTFSQLETSFTATLNVLALLLDQRDSGTGGHSLRVVRYATAIGQMMGRKGEALEMLRLGSLVHDIGKIGIPDSVLFKPDKLTDEEWIIMKSHPVQGAEIVSKIETLSPAVSLVLHHHEWYNGMGYPMGLKGEEIPLDARIFAVADAFDAMTSNRPYRSAMLIEEATRNLLRGSGTQFCPVCVDAFTRIPIQELQQIFEECHSHSHSSFASPHLIGVEFTSRQKS